MSTPRFAGILRGQRKVPELAGIAHCGQRCQFLLDLALLTPPA
jgi:hypothetical protein